MTSNKQTARKKAGPGRPKGSVNKTTAEVKTMIRQALEDAGGVAYLVECARDPKTKAAFLSLVGKLAPMVLAGDAENPLNAIMKIELAPLR